MKLTLSSQFLSQFQSFCNKHKLRETPKVSTTTSALKSAEGTRLIAVPNGKKVENWAIRSQVSKSVIVRTRERFND
jgi:hypothetical protein